MTVNYTHGGKYCLPPKFASELINPPNNIPVFGVKADGLSTDMTQTLNPAQVTKFNDALAAHDPTPPTPAPSIEQRVAALEAAVF